MESVNAENVLFTYIYLYVRAAVEFSVEISVVIADLDVPSAQEPEEPCCLEFVDRLHMNDGFYLRAIFGQHVEHIGDIRYLLDRVCGKNNDRCRRLFDDRIVQAVKVELFYPDVIVLEQCTRQRYCCPCVLAAAEGKARREALL